jgi:phosphohistidine phosphatase
MAQPIIILMRHAKSSWGNASLPDHDRPLNDRGRTSAPIMAQQLSSRGWTPERILSSTSKRTRETAGLMLGSFVDGTSAICTEWIEDLYLATPNAIKRVLQLRWTNQTTLVLGHNPGMEVLCSELTNSSIEMPTGAFCAFEWLPHNSPTSIDDLCDQNVKLLAHVWPRMFDS